MDDRGLVVLLMRDWFGDVRCFGNARKKKRKRGKFGTGGDGKVYKAAEDTGAVVWINLLRGVFETLRGAWEPEARLFAPGL